MMIFLTSPYLTMVKMSYLILFIISWNLCQTHYYENGVLLS